MTYVELPAETQPVPLAPGARVDRFEIVRLLGSGGSADVYEAEHLDLGRHVALKVVRVTDEAAAETLARFRREARTAGALHHPYIGDVFDVGHTDGGDPYLVMELLDGESVDLLATQRKMPIATALEIARQLAEALAFVHAHGVVHRDVKPHNLVLHREPSGQRAVKLVDFGISKPASSPRETAITRTGLIVGTPHYMPPEVLIGGETSPSQDLYATGVVLFECLTGRLPFDAASLGNVITAVLTEPVPSVTTFRPDCPDVVATLVAKAIARDPAARFESADAMRAAIEEAMRALGIDPGPTALEDLDQFPPRESGVRRALASPRDVEAAQRVTVEAPSDPPPPNALARRPALLFFAGIATTLAVGLVVRGALAARDVAAPAAAVVAHAQPVPPVDTAPAPLEPARPTRAGAHDAASAARTPGSDSAAKAGDAPAADPEASRALTRRALSAYAAGQRPRALALYRSAVRVDPGNADAWRGLGSVAAHVGQPSEARRAYRRYLVLAPAARDAAAVRHALEALP